MVFFACAALFWLDACRVGLCFFLCLFGAFVSVLRVLAFPCFVSGPLALPLCGAAPTFLCGMQRKVGAAPHRGNANRPLTIQGKAPKPGTRTKRPAKAKNLKFKTPGANQKCRR